jgi:hypothetical protein
LSYTSGSSADRRRCAIAGAIAADGIIDRADGARALVQPIALKLLERSCASQVCATRKGEQRNRSHHDMFTTIIRWAGLEIPKDRVIDGVDQRPFFEGKQENSNRDGFLYWRPIRFMV